MRCGVFLAACLVLCAPALALSQTTEPQTTEPSGTPLPEACNAPQLPMRLPDDRAPLTITAPDGNTRRIAIEIADDDQERSFGLMCRLDLRDDEGMLFVWPDAQPRFFWMRNTPLSLDIAFVGADGRILNVAEAVMPLSDTAIPSAGDARFVLEVRAGRAQALGVMVGAQLDHPVISAGVDQDR